MNESVQLPARSNAHWVGVSLNGAEPSRGVVSSLSEGDLLPPPLPIAPGQLEDAMTMLYTLISARSRDDLAATQNQIGAQKMAKDEAFKQELDAIHRAAVAEGEGSKGFFESMAGLVSHVVEDLATFKVWDAIKDPVQDQIDMWQSPKFWQDVQAGAGVIAEVALIAGAVASIIATGGAAAPVIAGIACAVSAGGMVVERTNCLDGVLGDGASRYIGLGMEVAGCVTGAGVLAFAGGAATGSAALNAAEKATSIGAGATSVVKGTAVIRTAEFRNEADHAHIDALAVRQRAERISRLVEQLLDGVQELESSHQRAQATVTEAIQTNQQTQLTAIFTRGR